MDWPGCNCIGFFKKTINKMKSLLQHIISEILDNKDFKIEEDNQTEGFSKLKIVTKPENMGIIIGKKGRMIKAIRTLLKTKATLERIGFTLEIEENKATE